MHKNTNRTSFHGFTVVELLIVIIVIGIIAALGTVGYKGVQERSYNTKVLNGVRTYKDAIESFYAYKNRFPMTTREQQGHNTAMACLGTGYVDEYCGRITQVETYEDSLFTDELEAFVASDLSIVGNISINVAEESFVGAAYGIDQVSTSSTGRGRTIQYALLGSNANCGLSIAYSYQLSSNPPSTACEIVLEEVPAYVAP